MHEPPIVEILWWRGCPSWERAIEITREQMTRAGLDPDRLVVREIADDEQAEAEGFPGSPTIRVGGRDIGDPSTQPVGLTCRVYRLRDGRISPLPDPADIGAALANASEGDEDP